MTEPATKPKTGRPTIFTDELAATICDRVSAGELLVNICAEDGMPSSTTFHRWTEERAAFREAYVRARRDQAEFFVEDMVRISDTEKDANRARVRVQTRQWLAERLNASKYGSKVALTGHDGGPLAIQVVRYELPAPKVIEHVATHTPQALDQAQPIDNTEDDKS
jgi:hypothetical protein